MQLGAADDDDVQCDNADSSTSVGSDAGYMASDERPVVYASDVPACIATTRVDHATGFLGLSRGSCEDASYRHAKLGVSRSKTQQDAHRRKVLFGSDHILP